VCPPTTQRNDLGAHQSEKTAVPPDRRWEDIPIVEYRFDHAPTVLLEDDFGKVRLFAHPTALPGTEFVQTLT